MCVVFLVPVEQIWVCGQHRFIFVDKPSKQDYIEHMLICWFPYFCIDTFSHPNRTQILPSFFPVFGKWHVDMNQERQTENHWKRRMVKIHHLALILLVWVKLLKQHICVCSKTCNLTLAFLSNILLWTIVSQTLHLSLHVCMQCSVGLVVSCSLCLCWMWVCVLCQREQYLQKSQLMCRASIHTHEAACQSCISQIWVSGNSSSLVRVTITPSGVETRQIPNKHITSLPIKLIGQQFDTKNECLNLTVTSSVHDNGVFPELFHLTPLQTSRIYCSSLEVLEKCQP